MKKHLLLSATLFLGILFPYTSGADTSDCPENWKIAAPNLTIKWDSVSNSFVSNFGEAFGLSDLSILSFNTDVAFESKVKKIADFFGADFVNKLRAEGGNVGLRDVLAVEPTFSDLSKIDDRTLVTRFPISWNYLTKDFNTPSPSYLLARGMLLEDIEGRKVKHFLEITKRGCPSVRFVTSNEVTIPRTGISQSPIGIDEWTRSAETYLRNRYEIAEKRTVNWLTFDSNIRKFKEVINDLESLSKTTNPPFSVTAELKPVVYVGEDDLQFVPHLMGIPAKTCFWDSRNQNQFYYYLDESVVLRSTPCKIVAIAPNYQKLSIDSKNAWDSLVLVEVLDIPVRKILTNSEAISIFQPIVNKLLSNKPNAGPQDVEQIYVEFKQEVQKLGITKFLIEGKNLIILVLNPKLAAVQEELRARSAAEAKAAYEELRARSAAEAKAAYEEFNRKLSEGLIDQCNKYNQTIIVESYKYGCVGAVDNLSWEQWERVSIPIPSPTISIVPDVNQPKVEESQSILLRPCSKLSQTVVLNSYKYTCVNSTTGLVWNQGVALTAPRVTPTPSASPSPNAAEKTILDAKLEAARILAEAKAKASAVLKKTTITCVKGKLTKKVTAVKPKCPSGYKLKN